MKNIILVFSLLMVFNVNAQTYRLYQTDNIHNQLKLNTKTGEVNQIQNDGQTFLVHGPSTPDGNEADRYALYKTKNIWTFILLDRYSGKLWQCQFSAEKIEYITSVVINNISLSYSETVKFSIQPMTSMFQYYLIDEESGELWKFQWSTKGDEYRWIEKI